MPPRQKKPQQTATKTLSVTSTKLAIATAALLAAGGLAFAAAPGKSNFNFAKYQTKSYGVDYQQPMTKKQIAAKKTSAAKKKNKCGVNSYSVGKNCGKGMYRTANIRCHDGSERIVGDPNKCFPAKELSTEAKTVCANACAGEKPKTFCKDPDGGIVLEKSTTVRTDKASYPDRCDPQHENRVLEGICEGDRYDEKPRDCGEGNTCEDGACVIAPVQRVSDAIIRVDMNSSTYRGTAFMDGEGVRLGHWVLTAQKEGVIIDDMQFTLAAEDPRMNEINSRNNVATLASLIQDIELHANNGDLLDSARPNNDGEFEFDNIDFSVTEIQPESLYLELTFNDRVGAEIEYSNLPVQAKLTEIEANGAESGMEVPADQVNLGLGNTILSSQGTRFNLSEASIMFETLPRIDTVPITGDFRAGGNQFQEMLLNGASNLYKFEIGAGADGNFRNNDSSWSAIFIDVSGRCDANQYAINCLSNFSIFDDNNNELEATFVTTTRGIQVRLQEPEVIVAGGSIAYRLRGSVNGMGSGNSLRMHYGWPGDKALVSGTAAEQMSRQLQDSNEVGPLIWSDGAGFGVGVSNSEHWYGTFLWGITPQPMTHIFPAT
ncbi:MAG: hypothetical protein HOE53_04895 [Candidatus Magasanikbacteria bacterium]|jgi:hypothetical protein|nr:hypothetical protein [Candidatus Magasanikbacteria bacterium]